MQAGFCIEFLIEAAAAQREMPKVYFPLRATDAESLGPALRRLIVDEPQYQTWVPSEFCVYGFEAVSVGERRLTDKDHPQVVALWRIAAGGDAVRPPGGSGGSYFARKILTNSWRLQRLAEPAFVDVEMLKQAAGPVPETAVERYEVRVNKTVLTWDGRLTGDTVAVAAERICTWVVEGRRGVFLQGTSLLRPKKSLAMAGALRVQGKDALAKALKSSPIRMLSPMYFGGSGEIAFRRR
ncbi:MAG: hypothetical protein L0191_08820 [Acidobacteria bacterium]|nr:hypothetical protein [Acidobacteriota bacterium]